MKGCVTYAGLELRPELQAAMDELDARGQQRDYAVHRTYDGQQWQITTKKDNTYGVKPERYPDPGAASAAGAAWLQDSLAV